MTETSTLDSEHVRQRLNQSKQKLYKNAINIVQYVPFRRRSFTSLQKLFAKNI